MVESIVDILNLVDRSTEKTIIESLEEDDPELTEIAKLEIQELEPVLLDLESQIKTLLLPKDPRDERNVIMEIRAGTGGDEAGIFGADLFRMYNRFAERNRWKVDILSQHDTGVGGIKEISFVIKGKGVYSRLKFGQGSRQSIMDILKRWQKLSADSIDFLRDEVSFNIVTIAEALAFEQLEDMFKELDDYGFVVKQLIVNNVIKENDSDFLVMKASQQKKYLDMIYERYSHLRIIELPMCPYEIKGIARLKNIESSLFQ